MATSPEHQTSPAGDEVAALRYHWGEAYTITGPEGKFRAVRVDGRGHLEATSGDELRAMIQDDYRKRPVPRGVISPAVEPHPTPAAPGDRVSADERVARVDALDLEPIVYKLMHPGPGQAKLTLVRADREVALYRYFLKLCVLHPATTIVPTTQLDHVWHMHILDTAKYRADCDRVFGRLLDHFPYAGLRGEEDRHAWREDFALTVRLFRTHFGVDLGGLPAASACSNHGDGADCCVGCIKPSADDARPRPERAIRAHCRAGGRC